MYSRNIVICPPVSLAQSWSDKLYWAFIQLAKSVGLKLMEKQFSMSVNVNTLKQWK